MDLAVTRYAERLAILIDRLARLSRELQYRDGLNPAQWETLRYLAKANRYSRSPSALAGYLGTTKGTASQTLISLESKGYVARNRCPEDRRQINLTLTPRGKELVGKDPIAGVQATAEKLLLEIGVEEMGAPMVQGLSRLLHDLQARHGVKEFGVCSECNLHCVELAANAPSSFRCGMTGDALNASEASLICVEYAPPGASPARSASGAPPSPPTKR
jgi:DNA-binding MarR family transcriptional regulator